MSRKYVVRLKARERSRLERLVSAGRESARKLAHARILLKCDQGSGDRGLTDQEVVEALEVGRATVERVRRRFCVEGPEAALCRRPQPRRPEKRRLDGEAEAKLVMLACSPAPAGRERWTLRLLANRMVELHYVERAVSYETVRRTLKKTRSSPG